MSIRSFLATPLALLAIKLSDESMCMMTSNVFGSIAAQNLGYARVEIEEAIALGDAGCRVVVYLRPSDEPEPNAREYFRQADAASQ